MREITHKDPHQIATLLDSEGIEKIVIIDDAYDPPLRGEYSDTDIAEFWQEVSNDDDALSELINLHSEVEDPDSISDEVLRLLWNNRNELNSLKDYCDKFLFNIPNSKLSQLQTLDETLENVLGRDVSRLGRNDILENTSAKIIFIDYYLGPAQAPEAVEAANQKAKEIYNIYSATEYKPLIILMSSTNVSEEKVALFRDDSELLGGMFFFIAKDDLREKTKVLLKLGALAQSIQDGYKVQGFFDSLKSSIDEVSRLFIADIKKLSLEDYAYVQTLSLQNDGQPLGDYMLWLYGTYFGHLLFGRDSVKEQRQVIDKLTFKHLPPSQAGPSLQLADIYKSALFDVHVDPEAIHPRAEGVEVDEENDHMFLHLGDLFFKDINNRVLMVLNAECDLAFTPDIQQRKFPIDRPILLIPGQLHYLTKELNDQEKAKVRTEIFEYEGEKFRILWDTKRIETIEYGKIRKYLSEKDYKLIARLRLPFALEVQRAFAADLTRIGMPVPPPIYHPVKVQVYSEGVGRQIESLMESEENTAFLFLTREGEHLVLNEDFICTFNEKIGQAIENLENILANIDKENKENKKIIGAIKARIRELKRLKDNYNSLLLIRGPLPIPSEGKIEKLQGQPISISRGTKITGKYRFEQPLLINIISFEPN